MALTPKSIRLDSALYDNKQGYPENFSRSSRLTSDIPATQQEVHTQIFMIGHVDPALQGQANRPKRFKLEPVGPSTASRSRLARVVDPTIKR